VIGTTTTSTCLCSTRAFIWSDGTLRDLGGLPGYQLAEAKGVNSHGDVVGRSVWSVGSDLWRATLWRHAAGAPSPRMVASE
jgi:probable HAF family extracellular repeat protein